MSRGKVVLTHLSLERLGMTREAAQAWAAQLNAELKDSGSDYARAVVTNDGALALDARLARKFVA